MPKGGRLLIETQTVKINEEFTPPYPHPVPGRYVLLSVSDTGMGMDPATLDHIFEPFFTTKEAGSGMGLGLATVYGIVKQHGGFLSVHSEIGRGTIFRVYLPAGTGVDEMPAPSSKERVRMGQETILLAEDHEELRSLARQMLISQGYHVLVAARSGSTVPRKPTEDSSGPPRCGDANSERTRCLSTNVRHQT